MLCKKTIWDRFCFINVELPLGLKQKNDEDP